MLLDQDGSECRNVVLETAVTVITTTHETACTTVSRASTGEGHECSEVSAMILIAVCAVTAFTPSEVAQKLAQKAMQVVHETSGCLDVLMLTSEACRAACKSVYRQKGCK